MSADERLTRVQRRAVAALLTSRTILEAAQTVGVGESTLRRWLGSDEFSAAYRQQARDAAREATTALLSAQREALDVLRECLHSGSPATRVRAARALLELGVRVSGDDLAERFDELEREVRSWSVPTPGLKLV